MGPGAESACAQRHELPEGFIVDRSPERQAEHVWADARSRRREGRSRVPIYVAVVGLSIVALAWFVAKAPGWLARRSLEASRVDAPAFSFRGREYTAHELRGYTITWRRGGPSGARALPQQSMRARSAFANMASVLKSAAKALEHDHGGWSDAHPMSAEQLGSELELDSVVVYLAADEAIVYARHPTFSGHFAEIAVDREGRVIDASLAG